MSHLPPTYERFRSAFPELSTAYDALGEAAHRQGPVDLKTRHLIKLGLSVGARAEGAVRSHAKRAAEAGASQEEILQVVALAVTSIGFGPAVAAYSWITDALGDLGR